MNQRDNWELATVCMQKIKPMVRNSYTQYKTMYKDQGIECDDLYQEIIIKIHQFLENTKLKKSLTEDEIFAYSNTIAKNLLIDKTRGQKKVIPTVSLLTNPNEAPPYTDIDLQERTEFEPYAYDVAEPANKLDYLLEAIKVELDDVSFNVVYDKVYNYMTYKEIGVSYGFTSQRAEQIYKEAILKLRKKIKNFT